MAGFAGLLKGAGKLLGKGKGLLKAKGGLKGLAKGFLPGGGGAGGGIPGADSGGLLGNVGSVVSGQKKSMFKGRFLKMLKKTAGKVAKSAKTAIVNKTPGLTKFQSFLDQNKKSMEFQKKSNINIKQLAKQHNLDKSVVLGVADKLVDENRSFSEFSKNAEVKISILETEISQLRNKEKSLEDRLTKLTAPTIGTEVSQLKDQIADIENKISDANSELLSLSSKNDNNSLKKKETLVNYLRDLGDRRKEYSTKLNHLYQTNTDNAEELNVITDELQSTRDLILDKEGQLNALKQELANRKIAHDDEAAELNRRLQQSTIEANEFLVESAKNNSENMTALMDTSKVTFDALENYNKDTKEALSHATESILSQVSEVRNDIATSDSGDSPAHVAAPVAQDEGPAEDEGGGGGDLMETIMDFIVQKLMGWLALIPLVWGLIKQLGPFIWNSIKKFGPIVWDYIKKGVEWIWDSIKTVFNWWLEGMKFLYIKLPKFIWEKLKSFGTWLWDEYLKPLFSWIGEGVSKVWNSAKDGFKKVGGWFSDLGKSIGEWFGKVGEWFGKLWDGVKKFFNDYVVEPFKKLWNFVTELPKKLIKFVRENFDKIIDFIFDLPKKIFNFVKKLPDTIFNAIKKWGSKLFGMLPGKVQEFLRPFIDPIKKVVDFIKGIIDKIWGAVSKVLNILNIKEKVKKAAEAAKAKAKELKDKAVNWYNNIDKADEIQDDKNSRGSESVARGKELRKSGWKPDLNSSLKDIHAYYDSIIDDHTHWNGDDDAEIIAAHKEKVALLNKIEAEKNKNVKVDNNANGKINGIWTPEQLKERPWLKYAEKDDPTEIDEAKQVWYEMNPDEVNDYENAQKAKARLNMPSQAKLSNPSAYPENNDADKIANKVGDQVQSRLGPTIEAANAMEKEKNTTVVSTITDRKVYDTSSLMYGF